MVMPSNPPACHTGTASMCNGSGVKSPSGKERGGVSRTGISV
jgi:hypothetical protein